MLNGSAFQTVNFPEIIDTIIKYTTLPKDYAETEECITGWFPDTHSGAVVPNKATNEQLVTRLNLEKVDTDFQYRKKYFIPNADANAAGENRFTLRYPLKIIFNFLNHKAYSTHLKWSLRMKKM